MNTPEEPAPQKPALTDPATTIANTSSSRTAADPDNPPWGLLEAILVSATSVALLFIVAFIFAVIYVGINYRGMPVSQEVLLNDKTYILIMVVSMLPAHVLTLVLAWAVSSRLGKLSPFRTLGLSWPKNFGFWKSAGLAVALFLIAMGLIYLLGGPDTQLEKILRSSRSAALTIAFLATVTAPAMEEVVYRGLLYPSLQRLTGAIAAVALVTFIFAGLHVWQYWPNFGVISAITLLSLALTIVRARTGRLLPCYMIHLVFNGIQSILIVADPYIRSIVDTPQPEAAPAVVHLFLRIL